MALPRFYTAAQLAVGDEFDLPASLAHHAQVLRLRAGTELVLFNGLGGEYVARLIAPGRVRLLQHDPVERESPLPITLVQSWIATEKLEWVVEKAVELGASRIVLAPATRSVVQLDPGRRARRLQRLTDLIAAACGQCGRNRLPELVALEPLERALAEAASHGNGLVLDPTAQQSLTALQPPPATGVAVAVGPEGGFDEDEVALAAASGYRRVRLGPRTLRTETAGLAALAALQTIAGGFC